MIIKKKDSSDADIKELTSLMSLPLPYSKKRRIEEELRTVKSGEKGEKDAAYFIDFHFASSKRWAVIHDLRLEHQNRVAQIDHLLINRFFDIYLLETKNFSHGVKITDTGEFLRIDGNEYSAIESPIAQNKRHQIVIEKVFKKYDLMPKRLGMAISPSFYNYVLISTKSRVIRPSKEKFDTSMVIKADTLRDAIDERVDKMSNIKALTTAGKLSSFETVVDMAKRLASLHKPIAIDYRKCFNIEDKKVPSQSSVAEQSKKVFCSKCNRTLTPKVVAFCGDNKKRFRGKVYCFNCQKDFITN